MRKKTGLIITFFCIIMILCCPAINGKAASGFKYKDYLKKKTVKYSGIVPSYVIDGNTVKLSKEPPFISDRNIAYASANALFKNTLGVTVKYTKSAKKISFKFMGHTLEMYVGETLAVLDGNEIEAPCAPIRIKYKKSKIIATMVPSRFVAESLGMDYEWDSDSSTVSITVPFYYGINEEMVKYVGTKGRITFNGENIGLNGTPSLILSDIAMISTDSDIFDAAGIGFSYDDETGLIVLSHGKNTIHYCVGSNIAYVNGLIDRCGYAPTDFYISTVDDNVLYVPGRFTFENLGFSYIWNSSAGTSEIVYLKNDTEEESEITNSTDEISDNPDSVPGNNNDENDKHDNVENGDENGDEDKNKDDGVNENTDKNEDLNEDGNADKNNDLNDNGNEDKNEDLNEDGNADKNNDLNDNGNTDKNEDKNDIEDNDLDSENLDELNADESEDIEQDINSDENTIKLVKVVNTTEGYKFFIDKENCTQSMTLPIPKGINAGDFEIVEDLLGCRTELILKGNYSKFYKKAKIENTGEAILQIQIYYDPEKDETRFIMFSDVVIGCAVADIEEANSVAVKMDFVKNLYKKVIVLDAGHGDHDPGAQHQGVDEKDLNLKILLNCRELFKDTDIKVYYTRIDDTFLSLYDRAAFAELVGADMFISIHHNSSNYEAAKGTSVYYSEKDTYTSLNDLTSEKLAQRILENLLQNLETKKFATGTIAQNFVVVRDSKAPAILIEVGFMSNKEELKRLTKDSFSEKAAKTIVDTVLDIYEEAM